ncbi:hypothetical protein KEM56_007747 [Ascosphaera pollenicola]|nr:hypothetical protein KEM56_007747 [Ascosphaera pollenicola]
MDPGCLQLWLQAQAMSDILTLGGFEHHLVQAVQEGFALLPLIAGQSGEDQPDPSQIPDPPLVSSPPLLKMFPGTSVLYSITLADLLQWALKLCITLLAIKTCHNCYLVREEHPVDFQAPTIPELEDKWSSKEWDELPEDVQAILQRQARGSFDEKRILSYCPADGRVLGNVETGIRPATPEDINAAVDRAEVAFKIWKNTTFAERRKVLKTLLK